MWALDKAWSASQWQIWAGSNGALMFNREKTKVTLTQPESVAAMEFLSNLTHGLGLVPPEDIGELLVKGQSVFEPNGPYRMPIWREAGVRFEPILPPGPQKPTEHNWGSMYSLTVLKATDPESSGRRSRGLGALAEDAQVAMCRIHLGLPASKAALASPAYQQVLAADRQMKTFADMFPSCWILPAIPSFAQIDTVRGEMMTKIYKRRTDPQRAATGRAGRPAAARRRPGQERPGVSGRQPGDTMSLARYRAAVIGLGRMGSTFDEEKERFGRWGPPTPTPPATAPFRVSSWSPGPTPTVPARRLRPQVGRRRGAPVRGLPRDAGAGAPGDRQRVHLRPPARGDRGGGAAGWPGLRQGDLGREADGDLAGRGGRHGGGVPGGGIKLAVGASRSWDATYNRMRELIELGEVGEVLQVSGLGRCTLSSNGSHLLTLVAYLAGGLRARCEWVFGQMESDAQAAGDDDLAGYGCLQFANGVQAFVRSTDCGAADWEFEVLGTKGRLRGINDAEEVEFWKLAPPMLPGRRREPARHVFPHPVGESRANVRTVHNLLAAMESGEQLHCDGEAGREALEIAIAMRESHRRGGVKVTLPLEDRSLRMVSSETLRGDAPVAVRRAQETAARARDAAP